MKICGYWKIRVRKQSLTWNTHTGHVILLSFRTSAGTSTFLDFCHGQRSRTGFGASVESVCCCNWRILPGRKSDILEEWPPKVSRMVPENDSFQKGPFSSENHVKLQGLWHEHFVKHLVSLSQETNMTENNNDCSCHYAMHLESQRSFWVNDLSGSRYTLLQLLWCRRMASFFADSTFAPLLFDRPKKKSQKTVNHIKKFRRFYHKKKPNQEVPRCPIRFTAFLMTYLIFETLTYPKFPMPANWKSSYIRMYHW